LAMPPSDCEYCSLPVSGSHFQPVGYPFGYPSSFDALRFPQDQVVRDARVALRRNHRRVPQDPLERREGSPGFDPLGTSPIRHRMGDARQVPEGARPAGMGLGRPPRRRGRTAERAFGGRGPLAPAYLRLRANGSSYNWSRNTPTRTRALPARGRSACCATRRPRAHPARARGARTG